MPQWENFTSQKQWETYIKNLLRTNNQALFKSVVTVYNNQTQYEKNNDISTGDNKMGFNKHDAFYMSIIARKIIAGKYLNIDELEEMRRVMPKYWKQIMVASKIKMQETQEAACEETHEESFVNQFELAQMRKYNSAIKKCLEQNIACGYGICDECVLTNHQGEYQTVMNI